MDTAIAVSAFSKYQDFWKIAGHRPAIFSGTSWNLIHVAPLHLGQGTTSTRLPFQDPMVGVSTLNLQKKYILVAEKSCYLQEQSSKLFFSLREFLFSLIKLFFFSIWTVKTSLHSVLTTIQISKKKNLIVENKNSLSEKKLRLRALFFQSNGFQLLGIYILWLIWNGTFLHSYNHF